MIEVDVRGLSCPIPVIRAKEAMDKQAHGGKRGLDCRS